MYYIMPGRGIEGCVAVAAGVLSKRRGSVERYSVICHSWNPSFKCDQANQAPGTKELSFP